MTIDRRKFITTSVAGLAGYSVLVDARNLPPREIEPPGSMDHDARSAAIDTIHQSRSASPREPNMRQIDLDCDVLVAGGGMAGVCAAISATRNGARTVLVQDRSRLGGNASSEIRMHIVGADCHGSRRGWRESGLIEEFRLEDAARNPHRAYELWDLLLYDKCVSEPNLTLLLDTSVFSARVENGSLTSVLARCDKTETIYRVHSHIYCDCTGDSRLALESGAEFMRGRESRDTFGESLALKTPDARSQGSSILFTARRHDREMPYIAPRWARTITREHLKFRPVGSWEYGYWWIELGGMYDTIADNERLRFELLSIVLGVWNYIKNSGNHSASKNWALETVGMIPGKRESRRIVGDHVQTQMDLEGGWKSRDDGVSIGGWNFDEHPPEGFDAPEKRPFTSIKIAEPYNIAFSSLYSRSISNLMMAGRNISNSHVAFTSTRVMATCACTGQAVGTAAAQCARTHMTPRQLRTDASALQTLQQTLLKDDQTIRGVVNQDPLDLARKARITASHALEGAEPAHVIDGVTRDMPGEWTHRWGATMPENGSPVWIELSWPTPQQISSIQLVFDTGFHRELTLSASDHVTRGTVRGPQPETIREYTLRAKLADGSERDLVSIANNFQRLRRHPFESIALQSVRLIVHATNGARQARLYEIRCYT